MDAEAPGPVFPSDVNARDALATVQRGAEAFDAGVGVARRRGEEQAEVELDPGSAVFRDHDACLQW